jgi:hypothetical protein
MRTYWEPRKNGETKKEKKKAKGTLSEGFFFGGLPNWLLLHEISLPKRYETKGGAIGNNLGGTH